jgi:2-C-methyl-D-erythritol 2,4-cyclodiphosphate synthase
MGSESREKPRLRIGQSYDIHPLVSGRPLKLAGVLIDFEKGLQGHSDADVIYHAIADGLLGALALGDLGNFYPDHDQRWKNVDSAVILREVTERVRGQGYQPVNVDVTVIAERPKLAPYMMKMRENISAHTSLPVDCVSVKARTHEKLGTLGRGEGIAALAIVLVERVS